MSRYNFERTDYPLLLGIRMRRGLLSWGLALTAWSLLLGSTLVVEEQDRRLHWIRTALIAAALPIAGLGRFAVEDAVKAGRALLDYEDVSDAARQQLLWQEATDAVEDAEAAAPPEVIDGWEYLGRAAREWRTHLALLSPTDTGKSSFLYLLLGACSRSRETCVQAIEGKGAAWAGLPAENVVRINFRPTLDDAHQLCARLHRLLDLVQRRVDQGRWEGPQMLVVLEEYLALSSTLKKKGGAFRPYGLSLELSVESMAAVARGGGGQLILVSQSPNADDLKFSGGVRANFRIACLGSRLGGFDAVERMLDNHAFINKRERERIEAEYQEAKKQLVSDRHPLLLTNLLGPWVCFPLPYLNEQALANLSIQSLPVPDELLIDDGWLPGADEIVSDGPPAQPATIHRPKSQGETSTTVEVFAQLDIEPSPGECPSLADIEALVLQVLAKANEPLKAHQIKSKRQRLKLMDKDTLNIVLSGLARQGKLCQTDEPTPRYSLPPTLPPRDEPGPAGIAGLELARRLAIGQPKSGHPPIWPSRMGRTGGKNLLSKEKNHEP